MPWKVLTFAMRALSVVGIPVGIASIAREVREMLRG